MSYPHEDNRQAYRTRLNVWYPALSGGHWRDDGTWSDEGIWFYERTVAVPKDPRFGCERETVWAFSLEDVRADWKPGDVMLYCPLNVLV